ncbi:MAG TPA: GNAT family N-acetyltransferase [Chloroflexota bacterium]|nr:GNAT family N-acetyltransferase [Chloroflexota bacterium]
MVIRDAQPEDAEGIARVHVDSWRSTYRGIVPDRVLDSLSYEERAAQRRRALEQRSDGRFEMVADAGGTIIGWISAGPAREGAAPYDAEIYAIYLLAAWHGQGIGRRMMEEAVRRLVAGGHRSLLIWVLADNPTRHFYAHLGGRPVAEQTITMGKPLLELGYGWDDMTTVAGMSP